MRARVSALVSLVAAALVPLCLLAPWARVDANADAVFALPAKSWAAYSAFSDHQDLILIGLALLVALASTVALLSPEHRLAVVRIVLGLAIMGLSSGLTVDRYVGLSVRDVHPGWGGYAGAAAGLVIVLSALAALIHPRRRWRRCPDCASRMRVEARVCLKCGYREPAAGERVTESTS
jgi:hypothetical protein